MANTDELRTSIVILIKVMSILAALLVLPILFSSQETELALKIWSSYGIAIKGVVLFIFIGAPLFPAEHRLRGEHIESSAMWVKVAITVALWCVAYLLLNMAAYMEHIT